MTPPTDRRSLLITAGAAMLAATTRAASAQSTDIRGEISFQGGVAIPEGCIEVCLEDLAIPDRAQRRIADVQVESDGKSRTIGFSLAGPTGMAASAKLQVVARLERADGWLIARGSARFDAGSPADVTLKKAVY